MEWLTPDQVVWSFSLATVVILFALLFSVSAYEQKREVRRRHLRDLAESEVRLQLALWGSGDWFWEFQVSGARLLCTELARSFGWPPGRSMRIAGLLRRRMHPDDRQRVLEHAGRLDEGEREIDLVLRIRFSRDEYRWFRWRGKVVMVDAAGRALRLTGTCKDVSDERAAESQLRLGAQVMESASDAIAIIDTSWRIIRVNRSFTQVTGYDPDEVVGQPMSLLCPPDDTNRFERDVHPALLAVGSWEGETWKQHRSGKRYLSQTRISRILGGDGQATHYVSMFSDITRRREFEDRLHFLANYDPMTGLLNRVALVERLRRAINRAQVIKRSVAVLFLDLDHFKQINDSFGHAVGDDVLRAAARRISSTLRVEDTVARLGGDEFVVILERVETHENVARVATKLISAFQRELAISNHALIVTPSIGISLYPDNGSSSQELLEYADTAMYQAKKRRPSSYSFYEGAMSAIARGELERENQLRHALEENRFRLHYQPIVDSTSGAINGVEALLRWQHPDRGLLMPGEFIRLAEERGLIADIGAWVLKQACHDVAELNRRLQRKLYVSVNVSSLQVRDADFVGEVGKALSDSELDARLLRLELTESVIMDSSQHVLQVLHELQARGIELALDDFGTGYSSLSYLRRYPIRHLKIDKSFVRDIPHDANAASIVVTIIALSHAMHMGVTAEGVETAAQSRFLHRQGCREQQGFYFARPRTFDGLCEMLEPEDALFVPEGLAAKG